MVGGFCQTLWVQLDFVLGRAAVSYMRLCFSQIGRRNFQVQFLGWNQS